MKSKNIAELTTEVQQMLSDKQKELDSLENRIAREELTVKEKTEAMEKAGDENDLKAFQKAKAEKQDAADALQMHSARLTKLQSEPLITPEEYQSMKDLINSEMDAEIEKAKPKLKKASDDLAEIGAGISDKASNAINLLQQIQHELYLDNDRHTNQNGFFIDSPITYKKHYEVVNWSKAGVTHYQYEKYTGKKA